MDIGGKIKNARTEAKLTQEQAAEALMMFTGCLETIVESIREG